MTSNRYICDEIRIERLEDEVTTLKEIVAQLLPSVMYTGHNYAMMADRKRQVFKTIDADNRVHPWYEDYDDFW